MALSSLVNSAAYLLIPGGICHLIDMPIGSLADVKTQLVNYLQIVQTEQL